MKLQIRISRTDGGEYVAQCPSLPGCVSRGRTPWQARQNMHEAIRSYLAGVSDFVPERVADEVVVEV